MHSRPFLRCPASCAHVVHHMRRSSRLALPDQLPVVLTRTEAIWDLVESAGI